MRMMRHEHWPLLHSLSLCLGRIAIFLRVGSIVPSLSPPNFSTDACLFSLTFRWSTSTLHESGCRHFVPSPSLYRRVQSAAIPCSHHYTRFFSRNSHTQARYGHRRTSVMWRSSRSSNTWISAYSWTTARHSSPTSFSPSALVSSCIRRESCPAIPALVWLRPGVEDGSYAAPCA